MTRKYRLAVVTSHPIQYQAPLFRLLGNHPQTDLMVYFGCTMGVTEYFDDAFGVSMKWDVPLLDGYRYTFLRNLSLRPGATFFGQINPSIVRELWKNRYDAIVVNGYITAIAWLAFLAAWVTQTPIFFRGETDLLLPRSKWKRVLKRFLLPRLFERIDAFLCSYTGNAEYYQHYGVPESKLFFCPCAVDNAFWQKQAKKLNGNKARLKQELGIPAESPVILFVAALVQRKRPFDLLWAFDDLHDLYDAWLIFVGDGPLKPTLEQYAAEHGLERVAFAGFKNQSELAPFYAMADILVLLSDYDPSPKVVNEAMNFSLSVVVTDRVGTAADLVRHGENGFIYPVGNVDALRSHLSKLLENPELREQMGKQSFEIVSEWSYENDVKGILAALEAIHNNHVSLRRNG